MEVFTVSFFGHRHIDDYFAVEKKLTDLIKGLLLKKDYIDFLVGRDGEFDQLVASVISRCKRTVRDDNSAMVLVLPYLTSEYEKNERSFLNYYDEIEICAESARAFFKSAHQIRNRSMVDRSDLVLCYVKNDSGGAYQTMQYAKKVEANIINLPDIIH